MAFKVPTMPLIVGIYDLFDPTVGPPPAPRVVTPGQLRSIISPVLAKVTGLLIGSSALLIPRMTDIRPARGFGSGSGDIVQAPIDSGRWYSVLYVEDFAKGFHNEYRFAALLQIALTVPFPIP